MALPASGQLSMGDINEELGRSRTAQISLDTAENGGYTTINANSASKPSASNPASISEWYSYDHNASAAFYYVAFAQVCDGNLSCIDDGSEIILESPILLGVGNFYSEGASQIDTYRIINTSLPTTPDIILFNPTVRNSDWCCV